MRLLAAWNTELVYSGVPVPKSGFFLSLCLKRGFYERFFSVSVLATHPKYFSYGAHPRNLFNHLLFQYFMISALFRSRFVVIRLYVTLLGIITL